MARRMAPLREKLRNERGVEPPLVILRTPARTSRRDEHELETIAHVVHAHELVAEDDVVPRARRVDEERWNIARRLLAFARHRHQRRDTGTAANQQQRTTIACAPDEVSAERSSYFERV